MSSDEGSTGRFTSIQGIYRKAEQHIKQVELCQAELPFGAINEQRYAGHHLLKGLVAQESGSPEKAKIRQVAANRRFFIGTGVAIIAATAALIRVIIC